MCRHLNGHRDSRTVLLIAEQHAVKSTMEIRRTLLLFGEELCYCFGVRCIGLPLLVPVYGALHVMIIIMKETIVALTWVSVTFSWLDHDCQWMEAAKHLRKHSACVRASC
jgi:hypothetical protein